MGGADDAERFVALLLSRVAVVVLNVACSRVVDGDGDIDVDVDGDVDLESPVAVAAPVMGLESARIALAAVAEVEIKTLLLPVDAKAKARTAGVSWRLVTHNIQRRSIDTMLRVLTKGTATRAEDGGDEYGIQWLCC